MTGFAYTMDASDKYVMHDWNKVFVEAADKRVVNSLPKMFKDDPTTLKTILEIGQKNEEMAKFDCSETNLKAAYKQVVDSLLELFEDDPATLETIFPIGRTIQEMTEEEVNVKHITFKLE